MPVRVAKSCCRTGILHFVVVGCDFQYPKFTLFQKRVFVLAGGVAGRASLWYETTVCMAFQKIGCCLFLMTAALGRGE